MKEGALTGVKVVEYCQMVAGPYCAKLLADLGAEVVKIEPPGSGDEARRRGPFLSGIPHHERSGLFLYLNTNKLGATLDISNPRGRKIFGDLLREADILVEDRSPKEADELGLTYEALKDLNPGLVATSITPFGLTGAYRDFKAYHLNTFHAGGEGYIMPGGKRYMDRPPVKLGSYVGDYDAGVTAALATLGALLYRAMSGKGQQVDISKQECIMSLYQGDVTRYADEGIIINRASQGYAVGGILPCRDGYVSYITWFQHEWDSLVKLLGSPEWAHEERFKSVADLRLHSGEEANAYLLEWSMKHTRDEIYHGGQAVGAATAIVFDAKGLMDSEQMKAREFFVEIEHPAAGKFKYPSAAYKFSETPWRVARPAPLLGEHNEEIYCGRLGCSKDDLVRLRQAGII